MPQKEFLMNGFGSMLQRVIVLSRTAANNLLLNCTIFVELFSRTSRTRSCCPVPLFSKFQQHRPRLWCPKSARRADFPPLRSFERCLPIRQPSSHPNSFQREIYFYRESIDNLSRTVKRDSSFSFIFSRINNSDQILDRIQHCRTTISQTPMPDRC